ncbi:MAG TPA: hypothetical protein VMG10_27420 [Gemmataceae bacterium]|nr:hypothetical protein [Gemmataceae bacterium]
MSLFNDDDAFDVNDPDFVTALRRLERSTADLKRVAGNLATAMSNQLRDASIRHFEHQNGREKRRLPKVRKTLTQPGESIEWFRAAAQRAGIPLSDGCLRWLRQQAA